MKRQGVHFRTRDTRESGERLMKKPRNFQNRMSTRLATYGKLPEHNWQAVLGRIRAHELGPFFASKVGQLAVRLVEKSVS